MNFIRNWAKNIFVNANTIRYRIELRVMNHLINDHCGGRLGDKLLDAGAGSGEISLRLMQSGACSSIFAIEPYEENYVRLEANYRSIPRTKTSRDSLEKIPVADMEMDALISTQVFEHIKDDQAAAREVARVLRTGGYAIITTPHPPEIFPNDGHVRPGYTEEQMRALFEPFSMTWIGTEYFFTLPTLRRLTAAMELGIIGRFFTISWADREAKMSNTERKEQQPYGIACLFRKQ